MLVSVVSSDGPEPAERTIAIGRHCGGRDVVRCVHGSRGGIIGNHRRRGIISHCRGGSSIVGDYRRRRVIAHRRGSRHDWGRLITNHLSMPGACTHRPECQRCHYRHQSSRHAYHGSFSCCKGSRWVIFKYMQVDMLGVVLTNGTRESPPCGTHHHLVQRGGSVSDRALSIAYASDSLGQLTHGKVGPFLQPIVIIPPCTCTMAEPLIWVIVPFSCV